MFMDEQNKPHLTRYLPQVVAATFFVAVCPIFVVWGLRAAGVFQSAIVSVALGMALSRATVKCCGFGNEE
jgi:hypothetical protein